MEKRLQSLKLPRDLTLGGTKPKKLFTPNLNAARNKEKSKEFLVKNEVTKKTNNKKDLTKNRRTFNKPERFIQSYGIFSDGVENDILRKSRIYDKNKEDYSNSIPVPKIKKENLQIDHKNESKVLDDIMNNYYDSHLDDDEYEKLPFAPVSWGEVKAGTVPIKQEIKKEPSELMKLELEKLKIDSKPVEKSFYQTEQFSDYDPGLTLWSLPDSFAGKGLSDDPNVKTLFDYKLSDMAEGQIGKMKIHKSGRIEVVIGSLRYQFESAELTSLSEKIVAIDTKNQEPVGVVLGEIENSYNVYPEWTDLLTNS